MQKNSINQSYIIILLVIFIILNVINLIYSRALINKTINHINSTEVRVQNMADSLNQIKESTRKMQRSLKSTSIKTINQFDETLKELKGYPVSTPKKMDEIRSKIDFLLNEINELKKQINEIPIAENK